MGKGKDPDKKQEERKAKLEDLKGKAREKIEIIKHGKDQDKDNDKGK